MEINVCAPINQLGYGVASLNAVLSLDAAGHEPALWIIGQQDDTALWIVGQDYELRQEHEAAIKRAVDRTRSFNRNAPSLRIWHQFDLAQHVGKGLHAALTYFERNKLFPNELHHLSAQDIVIASSRWMKDILVGNGLPADRVRIARPGVDRTIFKPVEKVTDKKTTVFLAVGKWEVRKGHDVLVDVFNKAFTPADNVTLVMLTANPFLSEQESLEWARLYKSSPLGEKIQLIGPQRLPSQVNVAHVMAQADCGVFLSRAEGWNLDLAEMLAMGKHCITTNYSAHTEFATRDACYLVECDEEEQAYDGKWFFGFGEWAALGDSQIDQAVEHMRDIHKKKQEGTIEVNRAGIDAMAQFTWANFAKEIVEALQ